jgi:hypothetical protein
MKSLKVIIFSLLLPFIGFSLYAQWNNICQFNTYMNDIWFVDKNTGYACGGQAGKNRYLMTIAMIYALPVMTQAILFHMASSRPLIKAIPGSLTPAIITVPFQKYILQEPISGMPLPMQRAEQH